MPRSAKPAAPPTPPPIHTPNMHADVRRRTTRVRCDAALLTFDELCGGRGLRRRGAAAAAADDDFTGALGAPDYLALCGRFK